MTGPEQRIRRASLAGPPWPPERRRAGAVPRERGKPVLTVARGWAEGGGDTRLRAPLRSVGILVRIPGQGMLRALAAQLAAAELGCAAPTLSPSLGGEEEDREEDSCCGGRRRAPWSCGTGAERVPRVPRAAQCRQ